MTTNTNQRITTIQEWLALPALEVPVIGDMNEKGVSCMVRRLGFFLADAQESQKHGILEEGEYIGDIPLSVITIDDNNGEPKQYRLPIELTDWAYDIVSYAQTMPTPFPCKVEFGILNGQHYAEMEES